MGCDIIKKYIFLISLLIISLICVSTVVAADLNNDTSINKIDNDGSLLQINDDNCDINVTSQEFVECDEYEFDDVLSSCDGESLLSVETNPALKNPNNDSNVDFNNLTVDEDELNSFSYLNYLISNAKVSTILTKDITFNEKYDADFVNGIIILKNDLIIDGNNHVVNAKEMARIFNITGNNVTLMNFRFINAFSDRGGALYISGMDTKIINCTFINDVASVEAGSIYLRAPCGQIINSTFINSTAYYTGAVLVNSVNATVIGSYFENNSANVSAGALGWAAKDNGIIKDCIFVNNAAYNEGGGAIFWNEGKNGVLQNNTFIGNFANYDGAAIFWNYADNGLIVDCTFKNNNATRKGGAIFIDGKNNVISHSKFINNVASYGGAICAANTLDIFDCSFDNNNAESSGGAIYCSNTFINGTISNSNFTNNYAVEGACICIKDICENVKFIGLNFVNNSADTGTGINLRQVQDAEFNKLIFINNYARSTGGAIFVGGEIFNSNFNEITVINNSARIAAGFSFREATIQNKFSKINAVNNSVLYQGGVFFFLTNVESNTFDEINCRDNSADEGGVLYCTLVFSDNYFTNCNFENNSAVEDGGALYFYSDIGGSFIDNCSFINNTAGNNGGTIYCGMKSIMNIVSNSNFTNNFAGENGAGICIQGVCENNEFIGLNFINNTANEGAGIFILGDCEDNEFIGLNFTGNYAELGACINIRQYCDNLNFINMTFINNFGEYGVGIYILGEVYDSIFNKIEFKNNYAKDSGAAAFFRNKIYNSSFSEIQAINNSAKNGGAFSFNGEVVYTSFIKMTFINNSATSNGGALFFITPVDNNIFDELNFINNSAGKYGAVIYSHLLFVYNTITNSNFENNKAGLYGGLMYFQSDFAENTLENCNITNNDAMNGTIIYFASNGLFNNFKNLNISENIAGDRGLFYYNIKSGDDFKAVKFNNNNITNAAILFFNGQTSVSIENCEFADNAAGDVSDIYFAEESNSIIENSIFNDKNSIYVSKDSNINLFNNAGNTYYENSYFVLNDGTLVLTNNSLSNIIVNNGEILSKTSIIILDNETHMVSSPDVALFAYCVDDNGNCIISDNMTFDINGDKLTVPMNYNGIVIVEYNLADLGIYLVNATLSGNLTYCNYKTGIVLYLKDPQLNVSDVNITPDEYPEISVSINSDAEGMIFVELGNYTCITPINNRSAVVILPKLASGDYIVNVSYAGDDSYASANVKVNVHVKSVVLNASNMTRGWNSDFDYQAKLLDEGGNPIANKLIEFTIDKIQYYALTDNDGIAKIKPKLNVGEYEVCVSSPLSNQNLTNTVKIVKRIQNNKDLNVYYNSNKKYKVKIIGDDGKAESEGKSVAVYIDGKKQTYKTDKDGFITITLDKNLKVGSHKIKIQYKGSSVQNKITVKHLLTSKNIVAVKKSAKKIVLTAKLAKKLNNKIIKFKIKGKIYTAKTNKNGVAKISISNNIKKSSCTVVINYLKDVIKTKVVII